jgi:hypothetical protein
LKHATSHSRKTQVTVAKINTFLESFGASLEEFGLDDTFDTGNQISLHQATESGEIEDESVKLPMEAALPEVGDKIEAEDSSSYLYGDLHEEIEIKTEQLESEPGGLGSALLPPMYAGGGGGGAAGTPALVNGLTDEDAERLARAELSAEIPATPDGTHHCQMCNTKLGNRRSYIIHLRRHAGLLNFKCDFCPKTFQGRVKLNRHVNTHLREGGLPQGSPSSADPLSASVVSAVAVVKERGASPMMSRAVPVPVASPNYSCALCSKYFKDKPSLQEHTKMHLIEDAKAKFKPAAREKKVKKISL